jgi:hypothetical protein
MEVTEDNVRSCISLLFLSLMFLLFFKHLCLFQGESTVKRVGGGESRVLLIEVKVSSPSCLIDLSKCSNSVDFFIRHLKSEDCSGSKINLLTCSLSSPNCPPSSPNTPSPRSLSMHCHLLPPSSTSPFEANTENNLQLILREIDKIFILKNIQKQTHNNMTPISIHSLQHFLSLSLSSSLSKLLRIDC